MPNELEKKDSTRLPRHIFRKQLKKGKRRQKRQKAAIQLKEQQSLTNNTDNNSNETIIEDQTYLQQKAQWEERERQYNIINIARKKAIEAEKKARELAMVNLLFHPF